MVRIVVRHTSISINIYILAKAPSGRVFQAEID
jgi:hypothetical protein